MVKERVLWKPLSPCSCPFSFWLVVLEMCRWLVLDTSSSSELLSSPSPLQCASNWKGPQGVVDQSTWAMTSPR